MNSTVPRSFLACLVSPVLLLFLCTQSCVKDRDEADMDLSSMGRDADTLETVDAHIDKRDDVFPRSLDAAAVEKLESDATDTATIASDAAGIAGDAAGIAGDAASIADDAASIAGDSASIASDSAIGDAHGPVDFCDSVDLWEVEYSSKLRMYRIDYFDREVWGSIEKGSASLGIIEFIIDDDDTEGDQSDDKNQCPNYGGTFLFYTEDGLFDERVATTLSYGEDDRSEVHYHSEIADFNGGIQTALEQDPAFEQFDSLSIEASMSDLEDGFGRILLYDSTSEDKTLLIAEWKTVGCLASGYISLAGLHAVNCCDFGMTSCTFSATSRDCIQTAVQEEVPFHLSESTTANCGKTCVGSTFIGLPPEVSSLFDPWRQIAWVNSNYGSSARFRTCETIDPYGSCGPGGQSIGCIACINPGQWIPACSRDPYVSSTSLGFGD